MSDAAIDPRGLPPCDLVMKGGITSGVVYPGAVLALARRYRFMRVGGTSAGAIAAGVTAAAEYRRQRTGEAEMPGIEQVVRDLGSSPDFLVGLFQPAPGARPLFEILLGFAKRAPAPLSAQPGARRPLPWRAAVAAVVETLRRRPLPALAALLVLAGLGLLIGGAIAGLPAGLAIVVALLVAFAIVPLLVAAALVASFALLLRSALAAIRSNGFGICSGMPQEGADGPALTAWLHEAIQRCAGLPPDQPLTFAMLEQAGIDLEMLSTDLSYARPVRLPLAEHSYLFSPADIAPLFPAPVIGQILAAAGVPPAERTSTRTWYLPGSELPVVVGVRLSLSFPLLLSALRLYAPVDPVASAHPAGKVEPVEAWLSDGGITSNFPIHFFDSWLPRHPTFGLDLVGAPGPGEPDPESPVYIPASPADRLPPHWARVNGIVSFLRQAKDAAQNWRDNLQAELPGARDRVCQVRLTHGEGGLNLTMDPATIERLMGKGTAAGEEILSRFSWPNHRFTRYLTLMHLLSLGMHDLAEPFGMLAPELAAGLPQTTVFRRGHDAAWCAAAAEATAALIALGERWEPAPAPGPDFGAGELPLPEPVMRVTPRA